RRPAGGPPTPARRRSRARRRARCRRPAARRVWRRRRGGGRGGFRFELRTSFGVFPRGLFQPNIWLITRRVKRGNSDSVEIGAKPERAESTREPNADVRGVAACPGSSPARAGVALYWARGDQLRYRGSRRAPPTATGNHT